MERRIALIRRTMELVDTRGPATAYDYIQRIGLDQFPAFFVARIRSLVWATHRTRQRVA